MSQILAGIPHLKELGLLCPSYGASSDVLSVVPKYFRGRFWRF
jgi:hypothetical protein